MIYMKFILIITSVFLCKTTKGNEISHPEKDISQAEVKIPDVSMEEYGLYIDWRNGKQDHRLKKFSEKVKIKKIARNLKVKISTLKAAIKKVEPFAKTIIKDTIKNIRSQLNTTPLKNKILTLNVDGEDVHVISWVQWKCTKTYDLLESASYIAWSVAKGSKIVKTVALWCTDNNGTKLFSAKIGKNAFALINKKKIPRFAKSRYKNFFEDTKMGPHK